MANISRRWLVAGIVLAVGLWALVLLPAAGLANGQTPRMPGRDLAPIVISGAQVSELLGAPGDELGVYSYRDQALAPILHQVDHVTAEGNYTSTVGLPLAAADEVVFMAADMGDMAPVEVSAAMAISSTWYQIEVTDPLSPTLKGWAYLMRSAGPELTDVQPYVTFDVQSSQIRSARYALGFAEGHVGFDYLALFGSTTDILDRTKVRLETLLGQGTEDDLGPKPIDVIKDGPVRVLARGGTVVGYAGVVRLDLVYELPGGVRSGRVTTDWSSEAVGSTLYNAAVPAGLTIDGEPDAMPAEPVSPWWQVTGPTGTVVQVADLSQVGGSLSNFYRDDDALDPDDPGDNRAYGETGVSAVGPNRQVTLPLGWWFLETDRANVGAQVALRVANPLLVQTSVQWRGPAVFLPLVIR